MTIKLSQSQKVFLANLAQGNYVTRAVTNKTAQSLKKLGLIRYAMMVGWKLTEEGSYEAPKHLGVLDGEA